VPGLDPSSSSAGSSGQEDVLIEFRDVHKSFGSKRILQGASFKIRRGESVGIIGASGTGKSTTLRLAAGLLAPDRGEILICGAPRVGLLSDQGGEEPLRVGMVFQNAALFDSLTVGENVGFLLYEHTDLPKGEIQRRVADSLAQVGLTGVESLYPSELSGGMKKRVALARAVVSDKRNTAEQVLMYDEPTAGLDPVASTVVEDLIRSLQQKRAAASTNGSSSSNGSLSGISAYIVVTHQHSTIRRAVDRIIFLHQGKVVWEGSTAEFDTTDEPIVRQFAEGSLEGPIAYV
jgi:ABC-type transporter Mla maintaining outer membrane lipid asymmetry ATPase subunit MlaF